MLSESNQKYLRLGLCCQFADEPIKFSRTTATSVLRLARAEQLKKLNTLCQNNAEALMRSLQFCATNGIGAFRINSQILPLKTHPEAGYDMSELPDGGDIIKAFKVCAGFAQENQVRLSFHPDQFVVLNTPKPTALAHAQAELVYHAEMAEWLAADTINIHGGGAYGDKAAALATLERNIEQLTENVRSRLTLENDDKVFTPTDLLPICQRTAVPLVYDVHHHRCLPDDLTVEEATEAARSTWNREPLFHISSPLEGWHGPKPNRHHDYIDIADFPEVWLGSTLTVDIEAKAKELAIARLQKDLKNR